MGYYIEVPQNLGKAQQISDLHGGRIIPKPKSLSEVPAELALIVVVDNGAFEAAALAYDEPEFKEFTNPRDNRRKEYVLLDKPLAHKLARYKER
jgi:hypothetical protein